MGTENIFFKCYEVVKTSLGLKQLGIEIDPGDAKLSTLNYKAQGGQLLTFINEPRIDDKIADAVASVPTGYLGPYTDVSTISEFKTAIQSVSELDIRIIANIDQVEINDFWSVVSSKRIYELEKGMLTLFNESIASGVNIDFPSSGTSDIYIDFYTHINFDDPGFLQLRASGGFAGSHVHALRIDSCNSVASTLQNTGINILLQYQVNEGSITPIDGDLVLWSGTRTQGQFNEHETVTPTRTNTTGEIFSEYDFVTSEPLHHSGQAQNATLTSLVLAVETWKFKKTASELATRTDVVNGITSRYVSDANAVAGNAIVWVKTFMEDEFGNTWDQAAIMNSVALTAGLPNATVNLSYTNHYTGTVAHQNHKAGSINYVNNYCYLNDVGQYTSTRSGYKARSTKLEFGIQSKLISDTTYNSGDTIVEMLPAERDSVRELNYKFSTTLGAAGIAAGELRLDDANPNIATEIFISDTDLNGNDVADLVLSSLEGLNRRVSFGTSNYSNFHAYDITTFVGGGATYINADVATVNGDAPVTIVNNQHIVVGLG